MTTTTATATTATTTSTSSNTVVLNSYHNDYIFATAFDSYGRRMATVSGDRTIRIWDLQQVPVAVVAVEAAPGGGGGGGIQQQQQGDGVNQNKNGNTTTTTTTTKWVPTYSWQAHKGTITSIDWAHAEFGSIVVTAGTDQEVKIWEEIHSSSSSLSSNTNNNSNSNNSNNNSNSTTEPMAATTTTTPSNQPTATSSTNSSSRLVKWDMKISLTDAKRSVTAIQFSPKHIGLQLATCSEDGCIRIYTALEEQMDLSQWTLNTTLSIVGALVVGGVSSNSSGIGDSSDKNNNNNNNNNTNTNTTTSDHHQQIRCTSLSWCTGRYDPPMIVVGYTSYSGSDVQQQQQQRGSGSSGGDNNGAIIYRYSTTTRSWQSIVQLLSSSPTSLSTTIPIQQQQYQYQQQDVLDVAWAPNVGRRFHTIAIAHNTILHIITLSRNNNSNNTTGSNTPVATTTATTTSTTASSGSMMIVSQQDIPISSWRCQWNVTGTVLANCGNNGTIQLYKKCTSSNNNIQSGMYECVSTIQGDLSQIPL